MAGFDVFTRVEIFHRARGGTLIAWELHPQFKLTEGAEFTVAVSRSGVGDFEEVTTINDTMFAVLDPEQRIFGKAPRLFYQISLSQGTDTFTSDTTQIGNALAPRDVNILREIVRKENLYIERYGGMCGFLYKRRYWGAVCTACTDFATEEVTNSHCEVCFGTGIVGGYFDPVEYHILKRDISPTRRKQIDPQRGVVGDRTIHGRAVNCPWLDKGDVWINFRDDRRYFVQTVRELDYRGSIFVFDPIELRLAPATDIIYTLPRPDDVEPSSSSSSS